MRDDFGRGAIGESLSIGERHKGLSFARSGPALCQLFCLCFSLFASFTRALAAARFFAMQNEIDSGKQVFASPPLVRPESYALGAGL